MTEHHFRVIDAEKYWVEKAVLLYNIKFWLDKEAGNIGKWKCKIAEFEWKEYVWTYNSASSFAKLFPYMSPKSIARWLRELIDCWELIASNFNKRKYDRTKWYTTNDYLIAQKGTMDYPKLSNALSQNEPPIPDINTDINTDTILLTNTNVLESDILPFNLDSETTKDTGKSNSALAKKISWQDINKVLAVWNKFNSQVGYVNKGQRNAVEAMLEKATLDEAIEYSKLAISVQWEPFAPSIVTPYELRSKNIKLQQFLDRRDWK